MTDSILCTRDGAVATVTINRPDRRNALDAASWQRLGDVFEELSADTALRCVVVTGAGGKAFGSGNDITEFETRRANAEQVRTYNAITIRAVHAIENGLHPTIARIEGFCLGGGLEIALACDIRVASPDSTFGLPVKNMGIFLDPALSDTLVNAIGRAAALEMVLEGRRLNTDEALNRGIITRVTPAGGLDAEIAATVERVCAIIAGPSAMWECRKRPGPARSTTLPPMATPKTTKMPGPRFSPRKKPSFAANNPT